MQSASQCSIAHSIGAYRVTFPCGFVKVIASFPRSGKWSLLLKDETDIHWLPLIASSWTRKGVQVHVPTPGNNVKRYCFGAVDHHTGESLFRLSRKKDSKALVQVN